MKKANRTALELFHQGTNFQAYEFLGSHRDNGLIYFRVWAPNACKVYLVGDFNGWSESHPLRKISDGGVWECSVDASLIIKKPIYKYKIKNGDKTIYKADPYGIYMQKPLGTASVFYDASSFKWTDKRWLAQRKKIIADGIYSKPMNIYEVHLGSFKKHADSSYLSYSELAHELACYAKQMSYTHIELMDVPEHSYENSCGNRISGYYAPSSRFGNPDHFKYFINTLHNAGVGVILNWIITDFSDEEQGLCEFDGSPLYELKTADHTETKSSTRRFDVSKNEVGCFLISNAVYFAKEYHIDGLYVDGIGDILFPDKQKSPQRSDSFIYGKHDAAVADFFKALNSEIKKFDPSILMIADKLPSFTRSSKFDDSELAFDLRWDVGWTDDILKYLQTDPANRKNEHGRLTASLKAQLTDKLILPIPHSETTNGKRSLLDKMYGDYDMKFAGCRAFMAYMMTHPGKKLSFMSNEFGQFAEWNCNGSVEWFMLGYDKHRMLRDFAADLNALYLQRKELWADDDSACLEWVLSDSCEDSVILYKRKSKDGSELLCVFSFTPVFRKNYLLKTDAGTYTELICSDDMKYGGYGIVNNVPIKALVHEDGHHYITLDLPPNGAVILLKTADR